MKKQILILAAMGGFLLSCGGDEETTNDNNDDSETTEEVVDTEEVVEEIEEVEDASGDIATLIVGEWDYVESTVTIGEESMTMKSAHSWTMNYTAEGTFYESQTMVEGGEAFDAEGSYTLDGSTLKREGLLEISISSIDLNEMVIDNLGTTMKFARK